MSTNNISFDVTKNKEEKRKENKNREQTFEALEKIERLIARDESARRA